MSTARAKRGFTLVEAMVAVTLVAVGITGTLSGIGALSRTQIRVREVERMQRLAMSKYDELIGSDQLQGSSLSGNFSDAGLPSYTWEAQLEDSGQENLDVIRVTVHNTVSGMDESVAGLQFTPPDTSTTTSNSNSGGGQ